jgi:hypothetical protein
MVAQQVTDVLLERAVVVYRLLKGKSDTPVTELLPLLHPKFGELGAVGGLSDEATMGACASLTGGSLDRGPDESQEEDQEQEEDDAQEQDHERDGRDLYLAASSTTAMQSCERTCTSSLTSQPRRRASSKLKLLAQRALQGTLWRPSKPRRKSWILKTS